MNNKLYYWAQNVDSYTSDNTKDYEKIIEIKRLNFFIGKNNAGKSRFLRSLFTSKINIKESNFHDFTSEIKELEDLVKTFDREIIINNTISNTYKIDLLKLIQHIIRIKKFPKESYKNEFLENLIQLKKYSFERSNVFTKKIAAIDSIIEENEANLSASTEIGKKYIPILRGMRPVTDEKNKLPYLERTQKDYFNNQQSYSTSNIITGELLYEDLKIHLLGEPEQRDLIKSYEEKLSQYFFDNEPVSLIPKHDQDVVNIKIGKDKQFPISQLGDGLQQAIILTYEAFTKKMKSILFL